MSEQKVPRSVEQRIVIKFLVGENVPSAEIHQLRSAACLHTYQSRSYLNHLVFVTMLFLKNKLRTVTWRQSRITLSLHQWISFIKPL